ncbi:MAG: 4-hydroxy-tetrahydrodipicolinate synthase [bacterium]|nr:4-hydroxy-tetrahydrodipicolinate synthase [bacterium]
MIELSKLHGTGVALATPFTSNLDVDFEGLEKLLNHVIHGGVDYVVVMGTTGESPTINADEKKKILDFIAEKVDGTLPIVYGMGGNDTAKLQNDLKNLDTTHIDAILSANPYYNKPQQNGIIHHYELAADASKVPLILYNVPARTASNLLSDTTLELAEHENIIGTKEASGDLVQCAKIAAHKPDDFLLISGEDMLTVPMISVGAKGVISVLANLAPKPFSEMVNAALEGDFEGANETYYELLSLNDLVIKEGNPIGLKYAMKVVGICQEYLRPPLMVASKDLQKEIDSWTS